MTRWAVIVLLLSSWGFPFGDTSVAEAKAPAGSNGVPDAPNPFAPLPSEQQLAWQRMETTAMICYGLNTYTNQEWGSGKVNPKVLHPSHLDTDQWAAALKAGGLKCAVLVAKHHDGFCLWPSQYTDYSIAASPWKNGQGDIVGDFAQSCKKHGLKLGIYVSPWDRHEPTYGDSPRYNQFFRNQLTEVLTRYGDVCEVWFDGACGEGPNGKRQVYDWQSYFDLIYRLQPNTLTAVRGRDIRWVGNESGVARRGESSVTKPRPEQHDTDADSVWFPAECDVSIRPGWFHHAAQNNQVKSLERLLDIYFQSVGRNGVLLLNLPPDPSGLIHRNDVKRLTEWRRALDEMFSHDLLAGRKARAGNVRGKHPAYAATNALDGNLDTYWATDDGVTSAWLEVDLGGPTLINVINVQEAIALGERVRKYHIETLVDESWKTVAQGTIIGHKNLHRIHAVPATKLRLVIDEVATCPAMCSLGAYYSAEYVNVPKSVAGPGLGQTGDGPPR